MKDREKLTRSDALGDKFLKSLVICSIFITHMANAQNDFDMQNTKDATKYVLKDSIYQTKILDEKIKETHLIIAAKTLAANYKRFGDIVANIEFVEEVQKSIFDIDVAVTNQYPATGSIKIGKNIIRTINTLEEIKGLAAFALTKLSAVKDGVISQDETLYEKQKRTAFNKVIVLTGFRLEDASKHSYVSHEDFWQLLAGQHDEEALIVLASSKSTKDSKDG